MERSGTAERYQNSKYVCGKLLPLKLIAIAAALILAALLFSVRASSVTKTEVTPPEIKAFTLSLGNTIYIDYAVSVPDGAESSGLLVWQGEPPSSYVHDGRAVDITEDSGTTEIDGEPVTVFAYTHLAAKEFTDDVYAVPYVTVGGEYVYGTPKKYSVVQYVYSQKDNEELSELLGALVNYGAAAQRYFGYNGDRLADEPFVKVTLVGATLEDGTDFGMFIEGKDALPVPTAPSGVSGIFGGWYKDAEFTEKLDTVSASTTVAYAKWIDPIVDTDFSDKVDRTTGSKYIGGVNFNAESSATLETLTDGNGVPYLKYQNGRDTTVSVSKTFVGTSLSAMYDTDVFSFSFSLRAEEGAKVLTSSEFALESDKNTSGSTAYGVVNLATIASDGTVSSYGGTEIAVITSDAVSSINVAVDFAAGTLTYYGTDGTVIAEELFTPPSVSKAKTTKAWQKLIQKYIFYAYFDGGNTLNFYDITICEGNIFA